MNFTIRIYIIIGFLFLVYCSNISAQELFTVTGADINIKSNTSFNVKSGTTLGIGGNLIINGALNMGTGSTAHFNSAASQQVTGSAVFANIRKSGGGALTLNSPLTLNGILTLASGNINTSRVNLLTLSSSASVAGGSISSFINGPVAKITNTASLFTFPVGKGSVFRTIGVTPNSGNTTTWTAEYFNTPYTDTSTIGAGLTRVSGVDYYNLDRTGASPSNASVTISWGENNSVTDTALIRVARWNGALWINEGKLAVTGSNSSGTITSNVISSFSPFALAFTVNPPGLPVLTSPVNGATGVALTAMLDWSDVSATNYSVQVSLNPEFSSTVLDTAGISPSQLNISAERLNYDTQYFWRVKAANQGGSGSFTSPFSFTTLPLPPANISLGIIPGGYYNSSASVLNSRDTIKVVLLDSATCTIIDSAKGVVDSVSFTANISFPHVTSGSYYLFIYHRNHIAIASRYSQSVTRNSTLNYSFVTAGSSAFGSNMINVSLSPPRWAMIPGDANRDGYADGLDQNAWIAQNGLEGYYPADYNGDSFVDGLDQTIWINQNGQSYTLPCEILEEIKQDEPVKHNTPVQQVNDREVPVKNENSNNSSRKEQK